MSCDRFCFVGIPLIILFSIGILYVVIPPSLNGIPQSGGKDGQFYINSLATGCFALLFATFLAGMSCASDKKSYEDSVHWSFTCMSWLVIVSFVFLISSYIWGFVLIGQHGFHTPLSTFVFAVNVISIMVIGLFAACLFSCIFCMLGKESGSKLFSDVLVPSNYETA